MGTKRREGGGGGGVKSCTRPAHLLSTTMLPTVLALAKNSAEKRSNGIDAHGATALTLKTGMYCGAWGMGRGAWGGGGGGGGTGPYHRTPKYTGVCAAAGYAFRTTGIQSMALSESF